MAITLATARADANDAIDLRGAEFFESKIRPVLVEHCHGCHSANTKKPKGGLRLDTRESLLAGGESGRIIEPGDPENSPLMAALRHESYEMPPSGKLSDAIIRDFAQWIERGAIIPEDRQTETEGANAENEHWAFNPVRSTSPPAVNLSSWPRGDIDRFILSKQELVGVSPSADADRVTLLRRVTFDLTGMTPSPEEVDAFLSDTADDAFERVVDRLLASPRFGERWGRHWLDVARFAESTGHERNFTYPHAWRYRDYVIQSFNDDKPFDQFAREQLAGDLLPSDDFQCRDERVIATGFLAIGPKNMVGGANSQFRADVVDDQIDVTCRAFLGLTVSCARCHDHKFDPIPTADYYALAGIFQSTETLHGTLPGNGGGSNQHPADLFAIGENAAILAAAYDEHRARLGELLKPKAKAENDLKRARSAKNEDAALIAELTRSVEAIHAQIAELEAHAPPKPPYAMGVRDVASPDDTHILISGDISQRGPQVPRGVISAVGVPIDAIASDASGRLALADWIADRRNPLTARVMVNRVWRHLFGVGLVSTPDNFGATGGRPTHPELLDHLASRFMAEGWSVKRLIRSLVLSRTYGLDSLHDEANFAIDPDDVTLWRMRPRRIEAEALRDTMLAAAGNLAEGAPPFGSVVAEMGDGCLVRQVDPDRLFEPSAYRSVYLPNCRYFAPEVMELFDGASASLVVGDREVTTVPSQSLYLLNDEFVIDQARRMANRLLAAEVGDDRARVALAYLWSIGRRPTDSEAGMAMDHMDLIGEEVIAGDDDDRRRQAWTAFCQALFMSAEFRYVF